MATDPNNDAVRKSRRLQPNELRYELASRSDADACNAINNRFFKRSRSLDQWRWEFAPPHLPFEQLPYAVARDGAEVVGTQGMIIVPMISQKGTFWTAKGEDTIVHPRYWDRNALVEMYSVLFAFCERNGVSLCWGFNSRKGAFSRCGFQYFDAPGCLNYYRPLNQQAVGTILEQTQRAKKNFERPGGEFAKLAMSVAGVAYSEANWLARRIDRSISGGQGGLEFSPLAGLPGDEFEALSRRFVGRHGGITLHRSPQFLKWRLLDNPFRSSTIFTARHRGELVGYIAVATAPGGQALISDYLVCPPDTHDHGEVSIIEQLIEMAVGFARRQGSSVVHANSFNAHPADRAFQRALQGQGFISRATTVETCYRIVPGADRLPDAIADYAAWFLTSANTEGREG